MVDYCWYFCSFAFALLGRWLRPGSLLLKVPESAGGSKAEDHWSRVWDTGCLQLRAWVESNVAPFGVFVACQLYAKKTLQGRPYILAATWPSPPAQARPPHIQIQKPKCLDLGFWILDVVFFVLDLGFGILDRLSPRSVCSGPKRGCLDFGVWICRANSGRRINACSMKTFCPVAVLCKYRGVWFNVASFPYRASAQYPPKW